MRPTRPVVERGPSAESFHRSLGQGRVPLGVDGCGRHVAMAQDRPRRVHAALPTQERARAVAELVRVPVRRARPVAGPSHGMGIDTRVVTAAWFLPRLRLPFPGLLRWRQEDLAGLPPCSLSSSIASLGLNR